MHSHALSACSHTLSARLLGPDSALAHSVGQLVLEYVGEVVTVEEAVRRAKVAYDQGKRHTYMLRLGPDELVDSTRMGNLGRFVSTPFAQPWMEGEGVGGEGAVRERGGRDGWSGLSASSHVVTRPGWVARGGLRPPPRLHLLGCNRLGCVCSRTDSWARSLGLESGSGVWARSQSQSKRQSPSASALAVADPATLRERLLI